MTVETITLTPKVEAWIKVDAKKCYPKECCGIISMIEGEQTYTACKNLSSNKDHFIIDPKDYASIEDKGDILAIVHSHCNYPAIMSEADRVNCGKSKLPWVIISWPNADIKQYAPDNYIPPLIGRKFFHGVLDCYAIIRDYYELELGIILPEHDRKDDWWNNGENLYLDNYEKDGWVLVPKELMQKHDMIYMAIRSKVPNHAAIYLGDNIILQHLDQRLSGRDVYGGFYSKVTTHVLRRKELC